MAILNDKFYAIMALICCEEGRFAHQFTDKGRAHSLCLVNELRQALNVQRQAASIQLEESFPANAVR